MNEGVRRQMEAFREGFESVFSLSQLKIFYPDEVSLKIIIYISAPKIGYILIKKFILCMQTNNFSFHTCLYFFVKSNKT